VGPGERPSAWLPAALAADSVVMYMAAGASQEIARALLAAGKPATTPAALVESASLESERRLQTTLGALARAPLPRAEGPATLCFGEVFALQAAAAAPIFQTSLKRNAP
jgi:uroporphyrin-III C-methyltransferase